MLVKEVKRLKKKIRPLKKLSKRNHQALAFWAADCAERVLPYFEKKYPKDNRPRKAIETCRKWAQTGIFKMATIRTASLSAHAAARKAKENSVARFAARAAGQAVATAHVATHALGVAYAVCAAETAGNTGEREWQYQRLPKQFRSAIKKMHNK